jgi:hypothetical protein
MKLAASLVVFSAVALQFFAAPATQPVWQSDTFAIGFWCGPPGKFTTIERYQEIKDAGFNVVFPPCSGATNETNHKILDYCQQLGMKAFIGDSRIPPGGATDPKVRAGIDAAVAEYSKHPALAGYFIADEPGPGAYPALGEVVARLREKDPKHFAYINLLPTYAPEWAIGKSYDEYVRGFALKVKPPLISYDNYGFAAGDTGVFFKNLAAVRKVSLDTGVPFWNIVLVTQHGPYRNVTEGDLRFQAMNTLAYGATGLMWFTYWSPAESDKSFEWKHALINADGSRDPHYDMVKRVNGDLQTLGSILINAKAKSTDIFPAKDKAKSPLKIDGDALVTTFRTEDRSTIAMVVNSSWEKPLKAQATLRDQIRKAELLDRAEKKWRPIDDGKFPLDVAPGDAVLVRWAE